MKRRNASDCCTGKPRRPLKRPGKITDGIYASIFMYLKFFLVWTLVLLADFILEFRFEYLWPFWLALRSAYDCYKFQGLAFSIFFVCITITSDVACYLFIPVQWLMFAASSYVWVQYVWQTERGICLPSILLSFLFLYIEVGVRLRDLKSFPFHLDLCRPFAAHCVGYPVITLGFSFKSCISYRFRLKKQQDVQRENLFHMQLLQDALPLSDSSASINEKLKALPLQSPEDVMTNGSPQSCSIVQNGRKPSSSSSSSSAVNPDNFSKEREPKRPSRIRDASEDFEFLEQSLNRPDHCENDADDLDNDSESGVGDLRSDNNHIGIIKNTVKSNIHKQGSITPTLPSGVRKNKAINITGPCLTNRETVQGSRLESETKRLQSDLQLSRNTEQELRSQINSLSTTDRTTKSELQQLRQDNESLQSKLHKLVTSRQQEKKNLSNIEKKFQEEKKQRTSLEQQLALEKSEKRRRAEETAAATRVIAANAPSRTECTLELCKSRCWALESELKQNHQDLKMKEDYIRQLEHETQTLQQYRDSQNETEVLMSALGAMQDKNTHLESSLSAETRLKLDLFSALGEAKRQIEIQQGLMILKEVELAGLKSKVAEVMAFIPTNPSSFCTIGGGGGFGIRYSPSFGITQMSSIEEDVLCKSSLNPAASDYTPKMSQ